ncbi:class I SAM-dependent methyltransferase [Streptomyces sp. HNM0574]|uniref:class I SAM-dependent methyltransferase n=1 Tax=Streptomyces sp. HNM0574 TaxID=2714954 RepID=UPI00146F2ABC|nr:class I SAM-dependent methyltransferase [Streptomyces sp. HNM0574]NLU71061.1 class I SAM-dependent methyltransferase [Streptomyces sp. HNM0574]
MTTGDGPTRADQLPGRGGESEPDGYAFGGEVSGTARQLATIEELLDPYTLRTLDGLPLPRAAACWEAGAGAGSVARALAERVAPAGGTVLATDLDTGLLHGGPGLTVRRHDITGDPVPESAYDLVHARLLLLHLPSRARVLDTLVRSLRPGGVLVLEEWDCTAPPRARTAPGPGDAELAGRVVDGVLAVLRSHGTSMTWAREAPEALRRAGLVRVASSVDTAVWTGGGAGCRLLRINARQLAAPLRRSGLTAGELRRYDRLTRSPALTTTAYPLVTSTGVRPRG